MKKILILLAMACCFLGCEDVLDQQVPAHSTVDGNVITDQKTAEVALVGVYSYLASQEWEWFYARAYGHLAGTTRGSNSSTGSQEAGYEGDMIFNTMEADGYGQLQLWSAAYTMINGANTMISLTNKVANDKFAAGRKESILAEATFLRFFAHFHLFRTMAYFWDIDSPYGILYRTEPSGLGNHVSPRLSVAESYDKLLADLNYVIENGPGITDIYHVSKYTAMAFKAKLLAIRGQASDYEEVISLVDQILGSTPYRLHNSYYNYFFNKKTSTETIFARHFASNMAANNIGLTRARFAIYYTATDFLKEMCSSAPQYAKAVQDTMEYLNPSNNQITMQYDKVSKVANWGTSDALLVTNAAFTYMRLAELLLLKAEAIARTSANATQVCNTLNPLLARAGDTQLNPAQHASREAQLDAVYRVMIKEMGCESGLDWEASLRFKNASGQPRLIDQKGSLSSTNDLRRAIMPIPIQEIEVNFLMIQNPGYLGSK
jgi:starch-binding outer membrane protein, SusD/RagB family